MKIIECLCFGQAEVDIFVELRDGGAFHVSYKTRVKLSQKIQI